MYNYISYLCTFLFYVLCITLMFVIIKWPGATQVAFLTPETELYVILFTQEKTTG